MHPRKLTRPSIAGSTIALLLAGPPNSAARTEIEAVVIHPPMAARFQCSEHPLGDVDHVADALGSDCVVFRREGGPKGDSPWDGSGGVSPRM